ncbi:MAG: MFS transporter [Alphaproteobacteria bacterium]
MWNKLKNSPENPFIHKDYVFFWFGRLATSLATFSIAVALGWQVYAMARLEYSVEVSAFYVGMLGLVQFLPLFLLALSAGETVDRYNRRNIILICSALQCTCAVLLALVAAYARNNLYAVLAIASLFGVARAFAMPAGSALSPMLVPKAILPRAVAFNTLAMQMGMILGPWLGGVLSAYSVVLSYALPAMLYLLGAVAFSRITTSTAPEKPQASRLVMIKEGLLWLRANPVVLGAISLDFVAVLLGGVTALLPVYAKDILQIGADGFGLLRSAMAVGAVATTLLLAFQPIRRYAGLLMLGAVAVFGAATIIFSLSRLLWLSLVALMIAGGADAISVFIRQNLVQIVTPDHMRGRISAVSTLFISASNELGEFESGMLARMVGPIASAVIGGAGSMMVVGIWAKIFPDLRKVDRIEAATR